MALTILSTVQEVVEGLLARAGLTSAQYDTSALSSITRPVRSLYLSQVAPTRQALEMLGLCYFFTFHGGDKIYFRLRGAASVATIAWDELGCDGSPDRFSPRLANELEVPAQAFLVYDNTDNDYQPDTQASDRLLSSQTSTETLQVPLGFTAAEAKQIIDAYLTDKLIGMTTAQIALDRRYSRLQPTDVITVTDEAGATWRMRIVKIDDSDGVRKCDLVMDDASVYTQAGTTTAGTQGQTAVAPLPDTVLELLDIPLLRDQDDQPGFYFALKGSAATWRQAGIYTSLDGTTYTLSSTVSDQAVIGTCSTTLGNWSGGNVFDLASSVTVNVGLGELASYTTTEILTGVAPAYLVGSEIIFARTATLSSPGVYVLTDLLRGRLGTEWASTGHAGSERFVVLSTSGVRFFQLDTADLGRLRYLKGVSAGQLVADVTAETITPVGVALECYSPVDARVDRTASDHVISWKRRTRLSTRLVGALPISAPLGEASERYEVDIFIGSAEATAGTPVLRTLTSSTQSVTYSSANRTTDGTGSSVVYMRVYQLSENVGRGYPLITSA
jgi:hypothetical protein